MFKVTDSIFVKNDSRHGQLLGGNLPASHRVPLGRPRRAGPGAGVGMRPQQAARHGVHGDLSGDRPTRR